MKKPIWGGLLIIPFVVAFITACTTPFKGGTFYTGREEKTLSVVYYNFLPGGIFKAILTTHGSKNRIIGTGSWQHTKNHIYLKIDSIANFDVMKRCDSLQSLIKTFRFNPNKIIPVVKNDKKQRKVIFIRGELPQ